MKKDGSDLYVTDRYSCVRDQNQQQNCTAINIVFLYHYFQVNFYWGKKCKNI